MVFMMDSWWNPSVEYQAMDRIHRLGQKRPVKVIKLVVEDSIEDQVSLCFSFRLISLLVILVSPPPLSCHRYPLFHSSSSFLLLSFVKVEANSQIVQLQHKKLAMTEAALSTDPDAALGKLTVEDVSISFTSQKLY